MSSSRTSSSLPADHGTHVAGIAGGLDSGVAKGANIVSVQGLNCIGSASADRVLVALDWVVAHHDPSTGPAVISMSLGTFGRITPLGDAIKAAVLQGFPVVVAAGNDG